MHDVVQCRYSEAHSVTSIRWNLPNSQVHQ